MGAVPPLDPSIFFIFKFTVFHAFSVDGAMPPWIPLIFFSFTILCFYLPADTFIVHICTYYVSADNGGIPRYMCLFIEKVKSQ